MIDYGHIEPMALEKIPEIWDEYLSELGIGDPHKLPISRQEWIRALYDIPSIFDSDVLDAFTEYEPQRLGATIVFDNLVVQFIIELLHKRDIDRLEYLFDWFELLASDDNHQIRGSLIEVTLCESLLSNNASFFPQFYPFIEKRPVLLESFKLVSKHFRITDEIKALLFED